MRHLNLAVVLWLSLVVGCNRSSQLELSSASPDGGRTIDILLEHGPITLKQTLALVVDDGGRKRVFRQNDFEGLPGKHAYKFYEQGICCAEISWPTSEVAIVLVKSCGGGAEFVAYRFLDKRLELPGAYADTMRKALSARYRKELNGFSGDPLEWAMKGIDVDKAYRWKKIGNGRLMGGS